MGKDLAITESQCCMLIARFLNQEICTEEFCKDLVELWIRFRDTQEKIKETWDKPYDRMLVTDRLNGVMTTEEFSKRYKDLWRLDEISSFSNLIDRVHSACNIFNPFPESEWEIDEQQFRLEVYAIFENYRHEASRK
jgi:hypothetical protein